MFCNVKTISNENEFIIPRCDHKINFVLSYILFYSKEICWKKKRICWNTILMKFYVLSKCSEKNTERERVCVIIQSQHEKNEIFFLRQLKSETIEMHHFSCFFINLCSITISIQCSVLSTGWTGWAAPTRNFDWTIRKYTVDFIKSYMAEKVLPSSPSKHFNRPPEKRNLDKTLIWVVTSALITGKNKHIEKKYMFNVIVRKCSLCLTKSIQIC